jgi:signal transduction histidine kinase
MVAAAAWLDYNLFREFNPPKRQLRVLLVFMALWPLEIALMLFNETSLALNINATATLFEPLYVLFLALRARTWSHAESEALYFPIQLLIGIYTLISLSIIPFVLSGLGYINTFSILVMNGSLIYSLMTGAVLLFALHNHVRRMERKRVEAVAALAVSELHFAHEHIKRQEQGKFLDMLTHELKTPLAVMRMMLGSRQPSAQHIDHAERAVRDMNDVIERCRQAGAVDDDQIKINISEFSLESALSDLRNGNASPQRISLSTLHNVLLKTDEQVLRIILSNLIDNALKYSPPESRIDILVKLETRNTQQGASICVQNLPGTAGFPDPAKVFQKYYRNKSAHHLTGSGLGLYLVESLTKLLNGEIHYVPDQFMIRFSLWIPV